jgi:putative GTP pyrophosphokinase
MDFWASLEHKMRYKFEGAVLKTMNDDLFECAEIAARLDKKMYELNRVVERLK